MKLKSFTAIALATIALPGLANAASIIGDGNVILGVDDYGQLNVDPGSADGLNPDPSPVSFTTPVGLRHAPTNLEATSHGCLCEGWGVGVADAGGARVDSGSANNDDGIDNLTLESFTATSTTATSVVTMGGLVRVTHNFALASETDDLYRVNVAIENISGADIADLRYTRTFDWDVEPDTFSDVVTIQGTGTTSALLYTTNNGFADSDPFASRSTIGGYTANTDVMDFGPYDQGTNFDFGFGGLAAGETYNFEIFYGASRTEAGALNALGEVKAELYSLGQPSGDVDGTGTSGTDASATFMFGFAGVGGAIIVPDPTPDPDPGVVPVPASIWLAALGFGALAGMARRKRA